MSTCPPRAYVIKRWCDDKAYDSTKRQLFLVEAGYRTRIRYTVSERVLDAVSKAAYWWLGHAPHRHFGVQTLGRFWICAWCDRDLDA